MSFSPAPSIAVTAALISLRNVRASGGYSAAASTSSAVLDIKALQTIEAMCAAIIVVLVLVIGCLALDRSTTVETSYISKGTIVAAEARTVGSKSKQHGIIQFWVKDANNITYQYSTGIHYSKCPLVDYGTQVDIKVVKQDNPYTGRSVWASSLLTHTCRMK